METNNSDAEKKKVNEDLVVFMRKRSDHEAPRYTARLKTYVDIQRKRRRAAAARRYSDHCYHEKKGSTTGIRKKVDNEVKDKVENRSLGSPNNPEESAVAMQQDLTMAKVNQSEHPGSEDGRMSRSRRGGTGGGEDKNQRGRSISRSRSGEPSDRCGHRKKKKKCGHKKRKSRCRKKRKRSCGRKRRRRRSCSRRRRRKSCKRRRKKKRCCR